MKYKILISDFDDTLLRNDRTISERNIEAIGRYCSAGGLFTICSGRTYESIVAQMAKLGLGKVDIPILALQGAIIKMSVSGKTLLQEDLDNDLALNIIRELKRRGVYYHIYVDGQLTVDEKCELNEWYANISQITRTEVGELEKFVLENNPHIQKVLAISSIENTVAMERELSLQFAGKADMYISKPEFLEFTSTKAGKGKATEWLAKFMGEDIANVVAIGDSMNDYTMIKSAGVGVAVGNSVKKILDIADIVTATNDNDGVAEIIDRILAGTL